MRKGFALILVVSLLLLCLVIFSFYYFALRSHIDRIEGSGDKTIAYYICESGLATAMYFHYIRGEPEGIITIPTPFADRTHDGFTVARREYTVNYKASDIGGGDVEFDVWISSPRGFRNRTYHLTASSNRAFPIFIRGFPGK